MLMYMYVDNVHLCPRALQEAVTCQLTIMYIRVFSVRALLESSILGRISSYLSSISRPCRPHETKTKTKTDSYSTTLPAVLINDNSKMVPSRQTVVAWTNVIIDPPSRSSECTGECRSLAVLRVLDRAEAGKSDPIACGPRCLSLHSPQASPPPCALHVFVFVLRPLYSPCLNTLPSRPTSLLPPSFRSRTPSLSPQARSCHDATAHRSLSIAINSSASLLRSPPRPGSSSPRLITPASPTATTGSRSTQHTTNTPSVSSTTHTLTKHNLDSYSHPRTSSLSPSFRRFPQSDQSSISPPSQTSRLHKQLRNYVRVHSRTPIQWISKTRPVPRARPAVACTLPTVAARPK
jgi:hypothetical protein